ncbi:PQQ-dependent sugar dehydrogenase [Planosporangium flavigriseum]|uniref:PQQ-dependent sugar dehydrogenase n=1 Tax=Planosporangium flavigriseum TaxID=373681 RepID=UPI001EF29C88|nr:PQQ-dependent sugar dehydrogenase [Planosporangium flavigriseum]
MTEEHLAGVYRTVTKQPMGHPDRKAIGVDVPHEVRLPYPDVSVRYVRAARVLPPARLAVGALVFVMTMGLLGVLTSSTHSSRSAPRDPTPTDFSLGPRDKTARGDDLVSVTTLARNLDVPWGITFLPDGGALVTERQTLRILRVGPERGPTGDLTVTRVATITEAYSNNEGGLLGIAASPNFARDNTVFLFYTTRVDNRIAKLRLGGRPVPILTGIPHAGVHNGGRLMFGPDGYLYATTGDASRAGHSQDLGDLGGKILRMTTDGKPAPGNPFPHSLVWTYGHRNPEGLAWDREGNLYSAEIGEAVWDELNVIVPGRNYGWPEVQGIGNDPHYVDPIVTWRPEVGVSNGVVIVGRVAVVTCLRGQRIYLVRLTNAITTGLGSRRVDGEGVGTSSIRWRPGAGVASRPIEALTAKYGRLRAAIQAPDGSVWLTTSNRDARNQPVPEDDRILRLTLHPPSASPTGNPP